MSARCDVYEQDEPPWTDDDIGEFEAMEAAEARYEAESVEPPEPRTVCRCGHTYGSHAFGPCSRRDSCGCQSYRAKPLSWSSDDALPRVHAEHDRDEARY